MITDYQREAGNSSNTANLNFAEVVGQQLTNAKLQGTRTVQRWTAPDGTVWVLMTLSKADAAKQAADIVDSEVAQYAEWKAMNALDRMEKQLANTQSKPTVVTE
jgi:hypothetical protein